MVGILFDPPFEGKSRHGGALIGPQREEYATLCKQMTSRGPTLEYGLIRDRILEILGKDIRKYIETLPEEDREALMKDLDEIFSTIDMADPRPLVTINIVSLQYHCFLHNTNLKNMRMPIILMSRMIHIKI